MVNLATAATTRSRLDGYVSDSDLGNAMAVCRSGFAKLVKRSATHRWFRWAYTAERMQRVVEKISLGCSQSGIGDIQSCRRVKSIRVPSGVARLSGVLTRRMGRRIDCFDVDPMPAGGAGVVALLTSIAVIDCRRHRVLCQHDRQRRRALVRDRFSFWPGHERLFFSGFL